MFQSERWLNPMLRLRLSYSLHCYEAIVEDAASKELPSLNCLKHAPEAQSRPNTREKCDCKPSVPTPPIERACLVLLYIPAFGG